MKHVFETTKLGALEVKNRLIRSATWEGIATEDGGITEPAYAIYEELAKGGVGTIITGFTSVSDNDFYIDGPMRLSHDGLIPQHQKLVDLIHREHCAVIAQLALGAYYRQGIQVEPDGMTTDEIQQVIGWFIDAAVRAKKAGYDGVQIHAAHFFFLSRFISPRVNHRVDAYGGDNRMRILLDILTGIREQAPGLHTTTKINCSDFTYGGLDETESLRICKALAKAGIDSIEVSGNGTSVPGIRPHVNEAYFAPFAAKLAEEVDVPVILVGGLRSMDEMQKVLNDTNIQFLSVSRPLLREPDLPNKLQSGKSAESQCISCNRCYSSPCHRCVFRK